MSESPWSLEESHQEGINQTRRTLGYYTCPVQSSEYEPGKSLHEADTFGSC